AANTYTGGTIAADGLLRFGASLTSSSSMTAQGNAKVELAAGGNKIIKTGPLSISGTAAIDLADNRMITTSPVGTASAGTYSGVTGMVQRSYNFGDSRGPGLPSRS